MADVYSTYESFDITPNDNVSTYTSVTKMVKFFDAYFSHNFSVRYHVVLFSENKHSEMQYSKQYFFNPVDCMNLLCR